MSKRQWLVLLMLFLTYLLLGASIFYHIESELEIEEVRVARINRIEINALLHEHYMPNHEHDQHEILEKLTAYCGKSVYNYTENEIDLYKWDFYNSFYFAYTVVSTIGYGNLAPTNMLGRILMIFYGLIGIPMNGILLAQLGEFFGNVFVRAHKKYKTYKEGHSDSAKRLTTLETRKAGLAAQIFMYLAPGFVMFIFFPAFLFSYYEGWHYDEAVYYAFVTLTTIGFGDYVAGQDNTKGNGMLWVMYKVFLIVWISFGLGYLVMIMSFIARGMRSKRITRLEHKLAVNLKHTQSKIWNQFNKDVNYLRRVFNEIYMMKLKPVYRDDYDGATPTHKLARSCSFPDLRELIYGGLEITEPIHPRRRANSEIAPVIQYEAVNRVMSENDLQRIDKNATFASHAMVQPAELLARLVNALGYIPPAPDEFELPEEPEEEAQEEEETKRSELKGVEGFSDKEILASEKPWTGSGWHLGGEKMANPRMRAASEVRLQKDDNGFGHQQNAEWTWSGPAASRKIQEIIKSRRRSGNSTPNKDAKSRLPSFSLASVPKTIRPRWLNPFASKKNSTDPSRRGSLPGNDLETRFKENYLSHTGNTRPNLAQDRRRSAAPHYFTHTGGNLPNAPDASLLEETSLADFLRALTALHTRVGAVPDDLVARPQRKMGTAGLSPPKLPSLLSLFSPPSGLPTQSHSTQSTITAGQAGRRFSLRPVDGADLSVTSYQRKGSLLSGAATPRRFSLRPEENAGTFTPGYQRKGSLLSAAGPRRFSLRSVFGPGNTSPHNTPPYTSDLVPLHIRERQNPPPYSADPFVFECPKEPLVSAEVGPAQDGISLPVRTGPVPRRFSLRPAQIGVPPAPASPKSPPVSRPVPRWKGGMLHRQISELNLQRRARAFSLGDVHSIKNDRTASQPSPLALPNATSNLQTGLSAGRPTLTTDITKEPESLPPAPVATKIDDARQTSASILPISIGKPISTKQEEAIDLTLFSEKTETSNPFRSDFMIGKSAGSVSTQPIAAASPARMLKTVKTHDRKLSVAPGGQFELDSVVVEKPPSTRTKDTDSLAEVKVESVAGGKRFRSEVGIDFPSRKVSMVSQGSVGSTETSGDTEKSAGRKISAMSQQSIELGSISGSRKSSTSRSSSDKPRVSIDSYKPLLELTIEKPATNPFEQYKATVEGKLERSRGTGAGHSSALENPKTREEDGEDD